MPQGFSFSGVRNVVITTTIIAAPLMVGSVHLPIIGLLGALTALAAASRYLVTRVEKQADLFSMVLLGLMVISVVQALPLPPGVVHMISPTSWEIQNAAFRPLGVLDRRAWMTLSVDASLTWFEAAKLAILFLAYHNARDLVISRSRLRIFKTVAIAGICVAVIGIAHSLASAGTSIYGVYAVRGAARVAGPFVNGNHQAGLLCLAAAAALALVFEERDPRNRMLWLGATVFIVFGGLLTRSRGGTIAMVVAVFVTLMLRRLGKRKLPPWVPGAVVGGMVLVVGAWSGEIIRVFSDRGLEKIAIWRATPQLIHDFAWVGAGRGTFPEIYTRYQEITVPRTFTHAENVPLQMILDYGVIVGSLVVLAWLGGLWTLVRRRSDGFDAAIAGAAVALFLHNIVDFNLEMLGVALPAVSLLAARSKMEAEPRWWRPRVQPVWVVGGIVLAALGLGVFTSKQLPRAEARVRKAAAQNEAEVVMGAARDSLRDHPSDYLVPLLVAEWESRRQLHGRWSGKPLPWINRALILFPRSYDAHLLAARWLRRTDHYRQSVVEYRLALDASTMVTAPALLKEIITAYPRVEILSQLTVGVEDQIARWDLIASVLRQMSANSELAVVVDRELLELDPQHEQALLRRVEGAISARNLDEATRYVTALDPINPADAAFYRGEIAVRQGRWADAVKDFTRGAELRPTEARFWLSLGDAAWGMRDRATVVKAVESARLVAHHRHAAGVFYRMGILLRQIGDLPGAMRSMEQAVEIDGAQVHALRAIIEMAEQQGMPDVAERARGRLAQ